MKYKFWGILGVIFLFSGCASQIVTQQTYEMLGDDFSDFRFFISKDVVLSEIPQRAVGADPKKTRVIITTSANEINLKKSTTGRIQEGSSPEQILISFEEFKDRNDPKRIIRPTIAFRKKSYDGRYYFDYDYKDRSYKDKEGNERIEAVPGIDYHDSSYYVTFGTKKPPYILKDEPYLLYREDKWGGKKSRTMKGIR
jgi:hypothetical protein